MTTAPSAPSVGSPVNPVLGAKVLSGDDDLDFAHQALLPLVWQRTYSSTNDRVGWFGRGWGSPLELQLKAVPDPTARFVDRIELIDVFGRRIAFDPLAPGTESTAPAEGMTLVRDEAGRYLMRTADGTAYEFGDAAPGLGRLTSITDANGNSCTIDAMVEGASSDLLEVSCAGAPTLELVLQRGRLTEIRQVRANGGRIALMRYEYTALGDLCKVLNRADEWVRIFEYSPHRLMTRHVNASGLEAGYEYVGEGSASRVVSHWDNCGRRWRLQYEDDHTAVTDQDERTSLFHFDAARHWTGYTDPDGRFTRRAVDGNGNLRAVVDPMGRATEALFDERGNPIEYRDAAGAISTTEWHERFALPLRITDPLGRTTACEYDARGNLLKEIDPTGATTEYQRDSRGLATQIVDPNGGVKRLEYDARGQIIRHTDCSGRTTAFAYDEDGRLTTKTDALGQTTRFSYDVAGRLARETLPDDTFISYRIDRAGRIVRVANALSERTEFVYGFDDQIERETDPLGHSIEYVFDRARRLTQIVNENDRPHRFFYDDADRLIGEQRFDGVVLEHRYDDSGYLIGSVEAAGTPSAIRTTYDRDEAGRIVERQTGSSRTRFGYDNGGQLIHAINLQTGVSVDFEYDRAGRVVSERTLAGSRRFVLRHAFDPMGNRLASVLPTGDTVRTLYYGSGHAHAVHLNARVLADFERDPLHREIARDQGAVRSTRQYDTVGRLKLQSSPTVHPPIRREYRYDTEGRLERMTSPQRSIEAAYDARDRLVQFGAERFDFDPAGNRVPAVGAGASSRGRVEDNRLKVFEDKRFAYDDLGRLIEKRIGSHTVMVMTWDDQNCLTKAQVVGPRGATTTKYLYDPFGRRIAKQQGEDVRWFMWDGDRLLGESDSLEQTLYFYEPDSFVPLAMTKVLDGSAGAERRNYNIHCDQIGLPRELTDEDGTVCLTQEYEAWGKAVDPTTRTGTSPPGPPAPVLPLRYQGQYADAETGLHYNRHRYYDPDVGRFISQDPIGLTGGSNPYEYAPSPLAWIDVSGLAVVDATFKMAGRRYTGKNPTDRAKRSSGKTPKGMRGPNTDRCDMHAEIEAMMKAYDKGLRGGEATLTITGLPACPYCTGDVKTMARKLKLDKLTVNNNGQTVEFSKKDLKPIKEGGKGWKCG